MEPISNQVINAAFTEQIQLKFILSEFIYNCSHCFRSPLKSIQGLLLLLEESTSDAAVDRHEYLHLILQSIAKIECIVQEFEAYLSNSSLPLNSERVDIGNIMQEMAEAFKPQIEERKIIISTDVKQTHPFHVDVNRFSNILSRLLSNAIIFHDDHKTSRYIEISIDANAQGCLLRVKDNGIGITKEIKSRIFQPFYRGSEKSCGTGIGLFVAHELIKTIGGNIFVRSTFEEGSDFNVWIPNQLHEKNYSILMMNIREYKSRHCATSEIY